MNKTEAAYAQLLEMRRLAGEIKDWKFHPFSMRLADRTYYRPDFLVVNLDRTMEIHETKGTYTTDKGQLKIKMCAELFPWFKVVKAMRQRDGSFQFKEF